MRVTIFQPPYPMEGTVASAEACIRWMRRSLDELTPGEHDLVLLPEYANAPGLAERQQLRDFSQGQGAEFLEFVAATAERLGCPIALSGVVQSGARWFNRGMLFDAGCALAATYDKLHLTDAESDEMGLTPGGGTGVFEHAGVRMGFAICFDLYFPEHVEMLAAQGVDLLLCPSYQRSESPERICLLAQARALDGGAYLLRSSYSLGNPQAGGHSLVAAPTGALLAHAGEAPGVITVEIDPQRKWMKPASHGQAVVEHRSLIESHRRPAAYRPHPERADRLTASPFPRLCAHRGLSHACPENTLPAFAAAIAAGAHEIELDLWASRDGVPVVCHDESVDRTTNGTGKIGELDWAELRRLDASAGLGDAWAGVRLPRVEDVLEMADGLVGLNIHIKDVGSDGLVIRRVCDLLTQRGLVDIGYLALSTEHALQIACEYAPGIPRACLTSQKEPEQSIAIAKRWGCQRIQFYRHVTERHIEQAHEAGLICNLFWSDEPEDAREYVRMGIDVILTNCAHTLIAGGFRAL